MPVLSETQPADRAERVVDADATKGRVPNRPDDPRSVRGVGDPVADPTPATLKLYAGDWARFVAWCQEHHRPSLPASSDTLAAYLIDSAPELSRGALGRRRSAISTMHRQAGLPTPLLDPATRKALRIAAKPKSTRSASPASAAGLVRLAAKCPRDLPGLRDRALLLLAAATVRPRRRSGRVTETIDPSDEVAEPVAVARLFVLALDAEHVRFTPAGVELQLRTRTDEAVPSRTVTLTRAIRRFLPGAGAGGVAAQLGDGVRPGVPQSGPLGQRRTRTARARRLAPHPGPPHGCAAPDAHEAGSLMARSAASRADQAAEALDAFLRDRPAGAFGVDPGQAAVSSQAGDGAVSDDGGIPIQRRAPPAGPAPGQAFAAGTPLRLPHTDWLCHRLVGDGTGRFLGGVPRGRFGSRDDPVAARPGQPGRGLVPPDGQPGTSSVEPGRRPRAGGSAS